MMRILKGSLYGAIAACMLAACSEKVAETEAITAAPPISHNPVETQVVPPLLGADVPFESKAISADKGGELTFAAGTRITVPQGAFVDAQGQPVKGPVDLKVRQFRDPSTIIRSGIPMTYGAGDAQKIFASAGMLEVRAQQNGGELSLAQGKQLGVELESVLPSAEGVGLYRFEEGQGWVMLQEQLEAKVVEVKPAPKAPQTKPQPKPKAEDLDRFDPSFPPIAPLRAENVVAFPQAAINIEYDRNPALARYEKITWCLYRPLSALPSEIERVKNEAGWAGYVKPYKGVIGLKSGTRLSEVGSVFDLNTATNSRDKREYYEMVLTKKGEPRRLSFLVLPAFEGADFKMAFATYDSLLVEWQSWFDTHYERDTTFHPWGNYSIAIVERRDDAQREADRVADLQAKAAYERGRTVAHVESRLTYAFQANQMGIYNCDRQDDWGKQQLALQLLDQEQRPLPAARLYLANRTNNQVIQLYGTEGRFQLRFDEGKDYRVVGVTREGELFYLDAQQWSALRKERGQASAIPQLVALKPEDELGIAKHLDQLLTKS